MISGRDVIFISSIEWDYLWQIQQETTLRFARAGNRVLYIENTGIRAPGLNDVKRITPRLKHWAGSLFSAGVREVAPNIFVASPIVMPPFGAAWRRAINRRFLLPAIKGIVRRLGMRDPLLWTYLPTDTAADLIGMLSTPRSVVTYYCGADFSQLTPHVRQCRKSEEAILKASDIVLATCPPLVERCQRWNDNVHVVPAVVNLDHFPPEKNKQTDALSESSLTFSGPGHNTLPALPRPVIGYVGGLHRLVDYELLIEMARARPQWSWVFVGPVMAEVRRLAELPNAHLLGQRPHQSLVHYIHQFDVCLIPYVNTPTTATVVPLKLNEYLAAGKPIVATELPTICDFNKRHQVLITETNCPDHFLRAIERALCLPNDVQAVARRREVAALGDIKTCFNAISELIEMKIRERERT
jgi:glycosyltransferase involved in cell wall biosynthesis